MGNKEVYLHFMYSDNWENPKRFVVDEFSFDGGNTTKSRPFNIPEPPQGKIRILKCPCGGNSWSENGRYMHEYECDCCGQFVEVYPFTQPKNKENQ